MPRSVVGSVSRGGGGGSGGGPDRSAYGSLGAPSRSGYPSPGSSATPRRLDDKDLEYDDMYEWIIVFGGSTKDVQRLRQLDDDENPYLVLQEAFERVRAPGAPGERVLRTELKDSAKGDRVYLRVGACDDDGLMHEAQEIGFLKRVIDVDDDDSQEYGPSNPRSKLKQLSDEGWATNCDLQWGKVVGYAPFTKGENDEHLKWFEDPTHMNTDEAEFYPRERFFSSGERQRLVKSLMNSVLWQNARSKFGQECKYGADYEYLFSTTMAGGPEARTMRETEHPPGGPAANSGGPQELYLMDIYPLHCESERVWLQEKWTTLSNLGKPLPLEPIRRYFGTTIGLYFAWLEMYTRALFFPAVFGLLIYVVQAGTGAVSLNEMGDWLIAYSVFIALWSTLFLEMWKRRENELKHDWGTAQAVRHNQDIDFYDDIRPASLEQKRELEERGGAPKLQLMAASAGTLLALCIAVCLVAGIPLWIKAAGAYVSAQACPDPGELDGTGEGDTVPDATDHTCTEIPSLATWLSYGGSVINLVCIVLLQPICERVVRELTQHEQHRTYTEHSNSMTIKGFTLQFVIHYFVLFYVAFFKDGEFLGTPDTCGTVNEEVIGGAETAVPDCINDLGTQIFVVFVVKTFFQQIWEITGPKVRRCWRQLNEGEAADGYEEGSAAGNGGAVELFEEQHLWDSPEYEGGSTYQDFEEMCIQFGFVAIFAVSYPLGAAFALLNNLFELRVDGNVLLEGTRRPRYTDAENIGAWMSVLQCSKSPQPPQLPATLVCRVLSAMLRLMRFARCACASQSPWLR